MATASSATKEFLLEMYIKYNARYWDEDDVYRPSEEEWDQLNKEGYVIPTINGRIKHWNLTPKALELIRVTKGVNNEALQMA